MCRRRPDGPVTSDQPNQQQGDPEDDPADHFTSAGARCLQPKPNRAIQKTIQPTISPRGVSSRLVGPRTPRPPELTMDRRHNGDDSFSVLVPGSLVVGGSSAASH